LYFSNVSMNFKINVLFVLENLCVRSGDLATKENNDKTKTYYTLLCLFSEINCNANLVFFLFIF
jgi:hypothetical protein